MPKTGLLGNVLETVKDEAGQIVKTGKQQVVGAQGKSGQVGDSAQQQPQDSTSENASTKDIVKSFYEQSKPQTEAEKKQQQIMQKATREGKTPQETQELEALRQQLHKETYYDPTFNRVKKPQEEEKPAEKIEREKKEEEMKLMEDKKKKPQPLAVTREQNKAEVYRGASG